MQRLFFFSQLEYSELFISDNNIKSKQVTIDLIEKGMNVFIDNNLDNKYPMNDIIQPQSQSQLDSLQHLLNLIDSNNVDLDASKSILPTHLNTVTKRPSKGDSKHLYQSRDEDSFRLDDSSILSDDIPTETNNNINTTHQLYEDFGESYALFDFKRRSDPVEIFSKQED